MASSTTSTSLLRTSLKLAARHASVSSSSSASSSRIPLRTLTSTTSSLANADAASSSGSTTTPLPPTLPTSSEKKNTIKVSLLLSRQPILLRTPTPLETAYFEYNYALSRRLSQPFPQDFYFRKGSAAERQFEKEEIERRENVDFPRDGNQKVKEEKKKKKKKGEVPTDEASTETLLEPDAALFITTPRTTKADETNDITSLERALDRCLFLLIKDPVTGKWRLPERTVDLVKKDILHRIASLPVKEALGDSLDIWFVSHLPIGVVPRPVPGSTAEVDKTYFLRAHILSGAPESKNGAEYAWLTREEIEERLGSENSREYFDGFKDLLSE